MLPEVNPIHVHPVGGSENWAAHPDPYYVRYEKVEVPIGFAAILRVRSRNGHILSKDLVDSAIVTDHFMHRSAFNNAGDYIGTVDMARFFCRELGIVPEKISPDKKVCSIGKSRKDGKWYGWSHRGYSDFGVGDIIEKESLFGRLLKLESDRVIESDFAARHVAARFAEAIA